MFPLDLPREIHLSHHIATYKAEKVKEIASFLESNFLMQASRETIKLGDPGYDFQTGSYAEFLYNIYSRAPRHLKNNITIC